VIITGTGLDTVTVAVGVHNPDTFGFALGTNGTSFTTVNGALAGDQVAVDNHSGMLSR
jgi:hypothetical protein